MSAGFHPGMLHSRVSIGPRGVSWAPVGGLLMLFKGGQLVLECVHLALKAIHLSLKAVHFAV